MQLARGLLLQGGSGERRRRIPDSILFLHITHAVRRPDAVFEELSGLLNGAESGVEGSLYPVPLNVKHGLHTIRSLRHESGYLPLPVNNKPQRHRLHPPCGKTLSDFSPKYGGKFETDETVQHPAGGLRLHEIHIDVPGIGQSGFYGTLRHLVVRNAAGLGFIKSEHFFEMPGDSLPLTVGVGRQKNHIRLARQSLQLPYYFLLARRHGIFRVETVVHVNAQALLLQIPYVALARPYRIFIPQITLNLFSLMWRLHYHKLSRHILIFLVSNCKEKHKLGIFQNLMSIFGK